MDIIEKIKKLDFPQGQYIIVGSGPMVVRAIKESNDIDIVVSVKLFEKCKQDGWEQLPWTYPDKLWQIFLRRGYIELYLDVNCKECNPTLKELLQRSDTIQGCSFASLEDVIKFKRAYDKPKHLEDIQRIEEYLKHNKLKY